MAERTLFRIWREHVEKGSCADEFKDWCAFRAWFASSGKSLDEIDGMEFPKPDPPCEHLDKEHLVKTMTLEQLKCLANDMGVDIGEAKTKADIAALIALIEIKGGD